MKLSHHTFLLGVMVLCAALFSAGCAGREDAQIGSLYRVSSDNTPFYLFGPQQGTGPDQNLRDGTLVTLVNRGFGFSEVELNDGRTGFVPTANLELAPQETGLVETGDGNESGPVRSSAIVERYSVGQEEVDEVEVDLPEAIDLNAPPRPEFRY